MQNSGSTRTLGTRKRWWQERFGIACVCGVLRTGSPRSGGALACASLHSAMTVLNRAPFMPSRFFPFPNHRLRPPPPRLQALRCHPSGRRQEVAEFPPLGMATRQLRSQPSSSLGRGAGKGGFARRPPRFVVRNDKPLAHRPTLLLALPNMATNSSAIKRLRLTQHICSLAAC